MYNIITVMGTVFLSVATDILNGITEYVTGIVDLLIDAFNEIVGLFYTTTPTPALTVFGWLGLFSIAYALVTRVAIPFVRGFFVKRI